MKRQMINIEQLRFPSGIAAAETLRALHSVGDKGMRSAKALGFGVAPVPAFAMGVLTACFGGIVRDVLAGEPTILMRKELYVTPAALAAGLFVALNVVGAPLAPAAALAAIAGFALRAGAMVWGWSLPAFKD